MQLKYLSRYMIKYFYSLTYTQLLSKYLYLIIMLTSWSRMGLWYIIAPSILIIWFHTEHIEIMMETQLEARYVIYREKTRVIYVHIGTCQRRFWYFSPKYRTARVWRPIYSWRLYRRRTRQAKSGNISVGFRRTPIWSMTPKRYVRIRVIHLAKCLLQSQLKDKFVYSLGTWTFCSRP